MGGLAWLSTSGALKVEPPWQPHFAPRTSIVSHRHHAGFVLHDQFVKMVGRRSLEELYIRPWANCLGHQVLVSGIAFPFLSWTMFHCARAGHRGLELRLALRLGRFIDGGRAARVCAIFRFWVRVIIFHCLHVWVKLPSIHEAETCVTVSMIFTSHQASSLSATAVVHNWEVSQ